MNATKLVDANGNPISAQAAYDAAMSGLVYICAGGEEEDLSEFITPDAIAVKKSGEEIAAVGFLCYTGSSTPRMFYAGADPTGGVS